MKKAFSLLALFICCYGVFLLAQLPVNWLVAQVNLPSAVKLQNVEGSVWQANAERIDVAELSLHKVQAQLSAASLMTLDPAYQLSFGGALLDGPQGKVELSGLGEEKNLRQASLQMAAQDIVPYLSLPLAVEAYGRVVLTINSLTLKGNKCTAVDGKLAWHNAAIGALEQTFELDQFHATLSCEQGQLAINILPDNLLGLSFTAYLQPGRGVSGNGTLTPPANFPDALKPALAFIGRPDRQGRYRLQL